VSVRWDAELARAGAVRALELLDTQPEERFDRISRLVRDLLGVPMAFLTLMALDRQFLKSRVGVPFDHSPRSESLCTYALKLGELLVINDAPNDVRFSDHPAVVKSPHIRFYAGQPLRDSSGQLLGTLCAADTEPRAFDRRDQERLIGLARWAELELIAVQTERQNERVHRSRTDFVSMVSHELRTPLTSVSGSLELISSGQMGELEPEVDQLVGVAVKNTKRLIRLADDVLVYSRLQHGALRLRLDQHELASIVASAVEAVADIARCEDVALHVEPPLVRLRCDHDRLVQVLTNLLANAVRLAPAGSAVVIGGELVDDQVRIDVSDRGPGVPQHELDRIFEPFVQLGTSTGGAGLGLAITQGIVEAHCGSVAAHVRRRGGTTVSVLLPVQGPDEDRPWW
jgi:signal transduction histidine kinase